MPVFAIFTCWLEDASWVCSFKMSDRSKKYVPYREADADVDERRPGGNPRDHWMIVVAENHQQAMDIAEDAGLTQPVINPHRRLYNRDSLSEEIAAMMFGPGG